MRYGSVCSGIESATVAWRHLDWEPAFFSEIEPFPRAVLEHHYPSTPLHGDFTTIEQNQYGKIDLIVGGTPCQSFSISGLRKGLSDSRGNLALEYLRLVDRERPRWVVWENVPGVLSSNGGRDFGSIVGGLGELGYGFAYRVLDARYFGVPQNRRRVFVVGCAGGWQRAAEVLFECEGLPRNIAAREAQQHYPCIDANMDKKWGSNQWVRGGFAVSQAGRIRRITPTETERLMGFPEGYTAIPYRGRSTDRCPDGPRYFALGNSMAVPVMRWLGERIQVVDN